MADDKPPDKPITTWVRFGYPEETPIDATLFRPLKAQQDDLLQIRYGQVLESPEERMLMVAWKYSQAWIRFSGSSHYEELLANLGTHSDDTPVIQAVDFNRDYPSRAVSSHTEIRTVYFPVSIPPETREAVRNADGLVTTAAYGPRLQYLSPYVLRPMLGWIEGTQKWEGEDAVACVWIHTWKSERAEDKFKTTGWLPRFKDGKLSKPLAIVLFEQDLKDLGALGWNDYHVSFQKTGYIP
ncbi:hypothetical protein BHE90_002931 [Fusarium euwallaceae]|uniref:ABM domain-containing protein n=1 Tax=Fusarium euwallaceae TaxID=1147111 RepID=A0A430M3Q9_9HYPO|nr:hypothetical protein BHE90_002931 [Fusarium euwallaceae]